MEIHDTRYAKTHDGVYIAYQTVGDGPDFVWQFDHTGDVDLMWEQPSYNAFWRGLSGSFRVNGTAGDGFYATFDGPARSGAPRRSPKPYVRSASRSAPVCTRASAS